LFYFAGFERQSYTVGNSVSGSIPTTATGVGTDQSIPDAEAELAANGIPLSPLSLKLLPLYGSNSTNTSSVVLGFPNIVSINNVVGKVDYHPSDHHTFAGSYFYGNGFSTSEDTTITQSYFRSLGQLRAEFVTSSWTWTPNSNWVNDVRFGWDYHHRVISTADHLSSPNSYGINTGVTNPVLGGFPTIKVSGLTQLGGEVNLPKGFGPSSVYDLVDHVSYLHGKHAFKFGGEVLTFSAPYNSFPGGRGTFNFKDGDLPFGGTALEAFLAGVPDHANLLTGNPARVLTQWDYSGFVEDV
jgi:hypothetical protein